uniref:C2H2-type domain-containing protein n=1 Tax=viral metagenome TaxID=1070528 RepID=A0A6C0C9L5_9ZZZZ
MVIHICGTCKKQFYKKSGLTQHQNASKKCYPRDAPSEELEGCKCGYCNKILSSPEKLKIHHNRYHLHADNNPVKFKKNHFVPEQQSAHDKKKNVSRYVSDKHKKIILERQNYRCANEPGTCLYRLEDFSCVLWETNRKGFLLRQVVNSIMSLNSV